MEASAAQGAFHGEMAIDAEMVLLVLAEQVVPAGIEVAGIQESFQPWRALAKQEEESALRRGTDAAAAAAAAVHEIRARRVGNGILILHDSGEGSFCRLGFRFNGGAAGGKFV